MERGQITLAEAQLERSEPSRVVHDAAGNAVEVLQCPASMGTFSDPRDAVRGLQAARGQQGYAPPPPPPPRPWQPPEPAAFSPRDLVLMNRQWR